jgi:hypothetical protein
MFGNKDHDNQTPTKPDDAATVAELDRLSALSISDLAVEVMSKGFGSDGPASDGLPSVKQILNAFAPDAARLDEATHRQYYEVVGEGVQVLEASGLVRATVWGGDGGVNFHATRRGLAALTAHTVQAAVAAGPAAAW